MRIPDDVQGGAAPSAGERHAVVDQQPSNALAPELWLDEQSVEIHVQVLTRHHGGKPDDRTIALGDEHLSGGDLDGRDFDRIRVGQQRRAISRIVQRRPALQLLEHMAIGDHGRADDNVMHNAA
ncbi:MAG TPA: hypothetical protein VKH34_13020, partial [Vicinamibacterales bacterium]|nr:hypothetical protein [Vicinamibacterales bacterium]